MNKRDEFVAQMQAKLDEWNAEIDELEAKARKQKAQTTANYHAQLAQLKQKQEEAAGKLKEVQNASDDAWESLRTGAERIWDDMKQTFQETRKAFSD